MEDYSKMSLEELEKLCHEHNKVGDCSGCVDCPQANVNPKLVNGCGCWCGYRKEQKYDPNAYQIYKEEK